MLLFSICSTISQRFLLFFGWRVRPWVPFFHCTFKPHVINAVTGKTGAGKFTLLHILCSNVDQHEYVMGEITLHNTTYNLTQHKIQQLLAQSVKLVAQNFMKMLAPDFSVEQNIRLAQLPTYSCLTKISQDLCYVSMLQKEGMP